MDDSLRYLLAIVEHGNVSKAAESLFISQPALSRYIGRLEGTLGAELIDRSSHPLVLTPAGQRYCDFLQSVERMRSAMEVDLEGMSQSTGESVRLGITSWRSTALLPHVLPDFLNQFPGVRVTLFEGSNSQLHSGIRTKKLDLAVMNSYQEGLGMRFEKITNERIVLVGQALSSVFPDSHARGSELEVAPGRVKAILQRSRLLLLHPEHHLGAISRDFLASLGVRNTRVIETQNIVTAIRLAGRGVGLAFAQEEAVHSEGPEPLLHAHIRHADMERDVGLAWPVGVMPTASVTALAAALRAGLEDRAAF
jgi:DNA-binding transcriptional LysR family regulator